MGSLPGTNAVITALAQDTAQEDYDRDEADALPYWTGTMPCYYREKRLRVGTPEGSEYVVTRSLIAPIDCQADRQDVVTFVVDGETAQRRGTVRGVEVRRLAGHPLQSVRLTLEDA